MKFEISTGTCSQEEKVNDKRFRSPLRVPQGILRISPPISRQRRARIRWHPRGATCFAQNVNPEVH